MVQDISLTFVRISCESYCMKYSDLQLNGFFFLFSFFFKETSSNDFVAIYALARRMIVCA